MVAFKQEHGIWNVESPNPEIRLVSSWRSKRVGYNPVFRAIEPESLMGTDVGNYHPKHRRKEQRQARDDHRLDPQRAVVFYAGRFEQQNRLSLPTFFMRH